MNMGDDERKWHMMDVIPLLEPILFSPRSEYMKFVLIKL